MDADELALHRSATSLYWALGRRGITAEESVEIIKMRLRDNRNAWAAQLARAVPQAEQQLAAARQMISDLCAGRRDWTLRIPADHAYDPDLVLAAGLGVGEQLLALLALLRERSGDESRHNPDSSRHQDGGKRDDEPTA